MNSVDEFLSTQTSKYPQFALEYESFRELYSRKLWHQLTESVLKFVFRNDTFEEHGQNMIDLYLHLISQFEKSMNRVQWARIVVRVSKQYNDLMVSLNFLEKCIHKKRKEIGEEAWIIISLEIAHLHLCGECLKECQNMLESIESILESPTTIGTLNSNTIVLSEFYRVSIQYFKVTNNADRYLESSLRYLSLTDGESLTLNEKKLLAFDIGLAALLSRRCYNFSTIVSHRLMSVLSQNTEYEWLFETLKAFNSGKLNKWKSVVNRFGHTLRQHPSIKMESKFLEQKIRIMALIQFVFEIPPHKRSISFQTISRHCDLHCNEVEFVLMRTFSMDLLRGVIDEVNKDVQISYVIPRDLNLTQIKQLKSKLDQWVEKVTTTAANSFTSK